MCDNDRCCFVLYGRIKHFSWVYKTLVECADTDGVGVDNPTGAIKGNSDEVFSVEMMILVQMFIGSACSCNDRILFDPVVP